MVRGAGASSPKPGPRPGAIATRCWPATGRTAHRFHRTGPVDAHHQALRFTWELRAEGEPPFVIGIDIGEVAADGRLQSITGFFDHVAQPA